MGARLSMSLVALVSGVVVAAACGDDPAGEAATTPALPDAGGDASKPPPAVDAGPTRAPFGLDQRPKNATCRAPGRPPAPAAVALQPVLSNISFIGPMATIVQIPGDASRWFGGLLDGRIVTFPATNPTEPTAPVVVADIAALSGMTVNATGEGGLLGLAFHPKFASNGHLFVSWTASGPNASGMRSVISRITSTDGGKSFGQYKTILGPFDQPEINHNGGGIRFGTDGYLYLSFGDGGGGGDPFGNGQTKSGFFSKILRIDVDDVPAGATYGIPNGNPFVSGGGEPATFARGFRNPFRFSIDRATGDVWVGDVGQNAYEEIDLVRAGGNYGWPCREGKHDYRPDVCSAGETLLDPLFEYPHDSAYQSVTGGVVYRGSAISGFAGSYVFANFPDTVYALVFDPATGEPSSIVISNASTNIVDFGEDQNGEIYTLQLGGPMSKLVPTQPAPPSTFPDHLSKTGCVDATDPRRPAPGLVPYDVISPLWSDGADKERFLALPDGAQIRVGPDGDLELPVGTVLVKTFSLAGKNIETRLFVRHDDGGWAGYTYEWNDAQTDAVLLPSSKAKRVGAQTWRFPSRGQCISCHTQAAGYTLGLELAQLNRDFVYTATNRISNQLATLEHIGMFEAQLGKAPADLPAYPSPRAAGPIEPRARSYLHANCSHCHRPTGPGRGEIDLRFATTFAATKTCGATPVAGALGIAGAKIVTPGAPAMSVLSLRARALDAHRMPPVGSAVVDVAGTGLLDDWIRSLTSCP